MLDREKIVTVLRRRFPAAPTSDVAAAANAIIGLDDEWEEVAATDLIPCSEVCWLAVSSKDADGVKVLRRRHD